MSAKPYEVTSIKHAIQSLDLDWGLDGPARLVARLAVPAKERRELTLSSLPKEMEFKCRQKAFFKGALYGVRSAGISSVEVEYRDLSDLLSRKFETEFIKGQRLEDFLGSVARLVGLRPRFFGKFSQDLPAFDLGGLSYFQHLLRMGSEFGFHFTVHSSTKEMLFISLGAQRESGKANKPVLVDLRSARNVASIYSTAEVLAFDSQAGQPGKIEVSQSAIYESLGFLKDGIDTKAKYELADGRMESVAPASRDPRKSRDSLGFALSKQALEGESLCFTTTQCPGFPGDRVSLEGVFEASLDGKYLLSRIRTRVSSSQPIHEITVVRA